MTNVEDNELLFDSLFNKKQADPFNYYLDLIQFIIYNRYVYNNLLHYKCFYDFLVKMMFYTIYHIAYIYIIWGCEKFPSQNGFANEKSFKKRWFILIIVWVGTKL